MDITAVGPQPNRWCNTLDAGSLSLQSVMLMETGLLLPPDHWNHHQVIVTPCRKPFSTGILCLYIFPLNFMYFWLHRVFTVARAFAS